ncbi:hypothetical protein ABH892_000149 [Paenibacillus sp. RC254]
MEIFIQYKTVTTMKLNVKILFQAIINFNFKLEDLCHDAGTSNESKQ